MLLVTLRNATFICFHGDISHMDITQWIYFIVCYGIQTYWLWLVLFLRLKYVFNGSTYSLSKCTIRTYSIIFIFIPFATPFYLLILWFAQDAAYTLILLISFAFVIVFSCSLAFTFVFKLIQVFKSTDHELTVNGKNNKLLSIITKTTILATVSLAMTILSPLSLGFGYYAIVYDHSEAMCELGASLLALFTLLDVYTNYLCILVSYNCFHKTYAFICSKCDQKCKIYFMNHLSKDKPYTIQSGTISPNEGTLFTPVDGGEGTKISNSKYDESIESIDEEIEYVVHENMSRNQYETIEIEGDDDSGSPVSDTNLLS
eukprot:433263_1